MRRALATCLTGALLVLTGARLASSTSTQGAAAQDWPAHGGNSDETDFSSLTAINSANVGKLGLAWSFEMPGEASLEATPVAVGGTLYFTGSSATVYAVDGATGKLLWKFDPQTWKFNPLKLHFGFAANRGVAYADGRIFSAAEDGRLFALDARTGALIWTAETTDRNAPHTITGAPRSFDGKVIIGNGGADFGVRGYVTAYDQKTGKQAWRFYAAPGSPEENKGDPAMEAAAKTWGGEYWKKTTGGGPWDSITFDSELNRIYIGTANASPYDADARSPGGGDNLYTASIVALDADTGKHVWHYQINPRDSWDYDSTQQMTLATLAIDGRPRKVLMQAPKNGFFYVIDRETGKLVSAGKIGKATWADHIDVATGRPVETPNIRFETGATTIFPGPTGAHSWQSMSYSPQTGLVYIPYMQIGVRFSRGGPEEGAINVGGINVATVENDPLDGKGALLAWDPVGQKPAWRVPLPTIWNGGALSTAGGLVFQGSGDGYFSAYDAKAGSRLWRFYAGHGIIATPMSFAANGVEYVSILVGYGGSAAIASDVMNVGWKFSAPRRLLTFAIGGKAVLPPSPAPTTAINALDDPKLQIDRTAAATGSGLFMMCAACHGKNLIGAGGPAPDLRESAVALDPQSFWSVLHDGALLPNGMPRFETLTREQVNQLYQYIRAGAREALSSAKPQAAATGKP
jgi:quinohemoprotein ethanol dehydrogenase